MSEVTASIPALPSTSRSGLRRANAPPQWLAPVGLIVLSLIPVLAGSVRLTELMGGAEITANNARFFASPVPVTVHIVSVTVYTLLGALQFVPSLRRGRSSWHRIAGLLPGSRRRARRAVRPVDELLLSAPRGRWRVPRCRAVGCRVGNAGKHRAGCLCDSKTGLHRPRRVDDSRLRDRSRRWDQGVHWVAVGCHRRADRRGRRVAPHRAHDGGLGDQPGGG